MLKHLLVPLDGSPLAEAALAPVASLAARLGARLTLLHVVEHHAPAAVHGSRHLRTAAEAAAYLEEVARTRLPGGLAVACHVHPEETTDVARSIASHLAELAPDLIVMCTHGHGRLRDVLFGSIAQQVVAQATTPLLLIRSLSAPAAPFVCRKMLAPDDGTAEHEPGLAVCAELAVAWGAAVHLVMVVETLETLSGAQAVTGGLLPGATRALLDLAREEAETHLGGDVRRLQGQGLQVTAEVRRGEVVATLAAAAREYGADLLVIRTHGKAGTKAFWSSSLTPRLAAAIPLPLLLVPLAGK